MIYFHKRDVFPDRGYSFSVQQKRLVAFGKEKIIPSQHVRGGLLSAKIQSFKYQYKMAA